MNLRSNFFKRFPGRALSNGLLMATAILSVAVLCLVFTVPAVAGQSDTATVNYEVTAINELSIDNGGVSLIVHTAGAGSEPDEATGNTTYDITTNGSDMKIVAQLESDMPPGTSFMIQVGAPTGGSFQGEKTLSRTSATVVVTEISKVAEEGLGITYRFSATVAAGIIPQTTNIVTFTLIE